MYFMSNRFLKDNTYGFHVPQFQPDYIWDTTHPSHNYFLFSCVVKYIICGGYIKSWNYKSGSIL